MLRIEELIDSLGCAKVIITRLFKGILAGTGRSSGGDIYISLWVVPVNCDAFRLTGPQQHSKRMMDKLWREMERYSMAYLDDIVVLSDNWKDHMRHLRCVFRR